MAEPPWVALAAEGADVPAVDPLDLIVASEHGLPAGDGDIYEGTVRLKVRTDGAMGQVVSFVQRLREKSEFRLLRMENNRQGGVDIWIGLRQPVDIQQALSRIPGVRSVSPSRGRDLSPVGEDPPLTVLLNEEEPSSLPSPDGTACVYCKEPLEPGTTLCPKCRRTQA